MSRKKGIKHNIQCLCVLPQFRNRSDPPSHEFVVFSVLDESDTIEEKYSQCNNCGVIHKVIDLCRSEIATNRAEISILTKKDIGLMLPSPVVNVLENYDCDLPTWEHALFIVNDKKWEDFIVLEKTRLTTASKENYLGLKRIIGTRLNHLLIGDLYEKNKRLDRTSAGGHTGKVCFEGNSAGNYELWSITKTNFRYNVFTSARIRG